MCASSSFNIVISDFSGKQCAGLPAFDDVIQGFRAFAVGDDGVDAVGGGKLCSLQFGAHAAGAAPGAGAARQRIDFLIDRIDLFDQFCVRVEPRVAVIEPVDVRQDDQPFCTAEYGYDGREHVVVAEQTVLGFDLCVAYGVILIDDRDHAHFQQGVERIGQVFLLLFLLDVLCIEKDLATVLS